MTDRQLECIVAIADHKSLTGAAKHLYVSQSSLSQMLAKAEKELGVQLFFRTGTSMLPTYAGDQYLKAAGEISDIKQNLVHQLKDINHSRQGRITIGISAKRSSLFMPVVLAKYMQQFPAVEIIFIEEDQLLLEDLVLRGKVDIAFITHPLLDRQLDYHVLYQEHVLLALANNHPLNNTLDPSQDIDLRLAQDIPFVLTRQGHDIRRICDQLFFDHNIIPNIRLESHSLDVCLQMAAYGIGATMIPDTLAKAHPARNQVQCYRLDPAYSRQVAIVYRKNMYLSYVLKEFVTIASEEIIAKYRPAPGGAN